MAFAPALRNSRPERLVAWCGIGGGISVVLGYLVVVFVQVNAVSMVQAIGHGFPRVVVGEAFKLGLMSFVLFVPFVLVGVAIATILSTQAEKVHQLYFADLIGAGIGSAAVVTLMKVLSPPGCVMLAGALLALAAWRELRWQSAAVAAPLLLCSVFPGAFADPVVDSVKTLSPQQNPSKVVFRQWSPVFRVDVSEFGGNHYRLIHDGMWGSMLPGFDGDVSSLSRYDGDSRLLPYSLLPESPDVVIIGSAGGNEILASLYAGARRIRGVELNPITVSLLRDHFADFTGRVFEHPRVEIHNAEGRSFISRLDEPVDLIWFVAPDSYAAMNAATSGAFVLSESYLYTVEMIVEALEHLTDDGIICAQFGEFDFTHGADRTARYLASARAAFSRLGVSDFAAHVMHATGRGVMTNSIVMLKRQPFTESDGRNLAAALAKTGQGRLHFSALGRDETVPELAVIDLPEPELEDWYANWPTDVRPITDDAPFFWHFVRFRDALFSRDDMSLEKGLGEQLLLILLLIVSLFALVFLAIPMTLQRELWREIPHKGNAAVYFAALGMGFMLVEVTLIQRLTLFLGYPTYSLSITLFSILIFTGLGSLLTERFTEPRRFLPPMLGTLAALVTFYAFGLAPLVDAMITWPFSVRVVASMLILAPLGLCLGTFMPLGLRTVATWSDHGEEYVAWGWAVNGFFSVISSVGSTILAMSFGFTAVIFVALALYAVGITALLAADARA